MLSCLHASLLYIPYFITVFTYFFPQTIMLTKHTCVFIRISARHDHLFSVMKKWQNVHFLMTEENLDSGTEACNCIALDGVPSAD